MAVSHCSRARWMARGTSEEMSRRSVAGSPCVSVFSLVAERTDVFGLLASCSHSR